MESRTIVRQSKRAGEVASISKKSAPAAQASRERSWVVVARGMLLLSSALAGFAGLHVALGLSSAELAGRYVCPMHPEVKSARAGQCPICGMALTLGTSGSGAAALHEGLMPGVLDLRAVENVRKHQVLDFVRFRALPIEVRELRGAAWVEPDRSFSALFFRDQAASLTTADSAAFSSNADPTTSVTVQLSQVPAEPWDESTVRVRFEYQGEPTRGSTSAWTAGQVGLIEVQRKARTVLTVPVSAVLQSPQGPYVLRALAGFHLEKQAVELGETFTKQGFAVVLSGLRPQERVVAKASFFLDAERRLNSLGAEQDGGYE